MKPAFTEEHGDMRTFMEKVANRKLGARHTDPVVSVSVFEQSFEETSNDSQKEEEHQHSGCCTTTW